MQIIRSPSEMQTVSRRYREEGQTVALVPTMGYLHEGHLSLVRLARTQAEFVVVSLFVNPTQFGPQEDFQRYPRDLDRDADLCRKAGVDVLFCPEVSNMYPPDYSTYVVEETLGTSLCGHSRPGHFRGVTTVVAKLFNLVMPDFAVFGEKDAQQLRVIRRMVRDLNFPLTIIAGPIAREADGLAMSSRNTLLTAAERLEAPAIRRALLRGRDLYLAGERDAARIVNAVRDALQAAPSGRVDYIELVDDESLAPLTLIEGPALLAIAVFFSATRLIDNIKLNTG